MSLPRNDCQVTPYKRVQLLCIVKYLASLCIFFQNKNNKWRNTANSWFMPDIFLTNYTLIFMNCSLEYLIWITFYNIRSWVNANNRNRIHLNRSVCCNSSYTKIQTYSVSHSMFFTFNWYFRKTSKTEKLNLTVSLCNLLSTLPHF